ncbi:MAG: class I SAM-dependent methyltransferase [Methanolinea sp.]|nr:class I SAM-dependent methyltransferase [Methanolinea sp.]
MALSPGRVHHPHTVFSAEKAGHLDTRLRRLLYRPDRLADRYVKPGYRVLDFGCGPGFFSREFAKRVGEGGRVFAVDLQEEMLSILRARMEAEGLISRITTHRCGPDTIALPDECRGTFDVAFAIFVVHEVPDPLKLFLEIFSLLKQGGMFFLSEPPFVVSGRDFEDELRCAEEAGFRVRDRRLFFVNRAAVLVKE